MGYLAPVEIGRVLGAGLFTGCFDLGTSCLFGGTGCGTFGTGILVGISISLVGRKGRELLDVAAAGALLTVGGGETEGSRVG